MKPEAEGRSPIGEGQGRPYLWRQHHEWKLAVVGAAWQIRDLGVGQNETTMDRRFWSMLPPTRASHFGVTRFLTSHLGRLQEIEVDPSQSETRLAKVLFGHRSVAGRGSDV